MPDVMGRNLSETCQSSAREIHPSSARHLPIWSLVVTPASVPEFTIPSLASGRLQGCGREKPGLGNGRRHTIPRATQPSALVRALARCCPFQEEHDLSSVEDDLTPSDVRTHALSDPSTRAAMSLPHLSKITTPYGFLTLGESPCVRRRESLFFEGNAFQERLNKAEHVSCLTTHGRVKAINKTYYTFSKVGNSKTVCAPGEIQDSCDSSELLRPARLSCGFLRKGWIKFVHKTRWSR